jgi:hypothetical protein
MRRSIRPTFANDTIVAIISLCASQPSQSNANEGILNSVLSRLSSHCRSVVLVRHSRTRTGCRDQVGRIPRTALFRQGRRAADLAEWKHIQELPTTTGRTGSRPEGSPLRPRWRNRLCRFERKTPVQKSAFSAAPNPSSTPSTSCGMSTRGRTMKRRCAGSGPRQPSSRICQITENSVPCTLIPTTGVAALALHLCRQLVLGFSTRDFDVRFSG